MARACVFVIGNAGTSKFCERAGVIIIIVVDVIIIILYYAKRQQNSKIQYKHTNIHSKEQLRDADAGDQ